MFSTLGLFTSGPAKINEAYENGLIDRIFTTNLNYHDPAIDECPWHASVDMAKYVAYIIDTMNCDGSISKLLNPVDRIHDLVDKVRNYK